MNVDVGFQKNPFHRLPNAEIASAHRPQLLLPETPYGVGFQTTIIFVTCMLRHPLMHGLTTISKRNDLLGILNGFNHC